MKKAKKVGLKVVAIADHDTLEGSRQAAKIAKKFGIIVIPACEVTSKDGHILAYGIKEEIPRKLTAEETTKQIHQQGGLAIAAHPFLRRFGRLLGVGNLIYKVPFDGIEIVGPPSKNKEPKEDSLAAGILKLVKVTGSDSHVLDFIGWKQISFPNNVKNEVDVLEAIRMRKTKLGAIQYVPTLRKYFASFRDQFKFLLTKF